MYSCASDLWRVQIGIIYETSKIDLIQDVMDGGKIYIEHSWTKASSVWPMSVVVHVDAIVVLLTSIVVYTGEQCCLCRSGGMGVGRGPVRPLHITKAAASVYV